MRIVPVDERDSSWENDEPRFRIYVFEDAANAVSTFDVVNATFDQALEAAQVQSEGDRFLWSIALVQDDGRAGRGLIWLSGNDYNDIPSAVETAAYWRARGTMQNRYLMARSLAHEPVLLPTGERVIRLFPEYGVDLPLWESFTDNYPVERGALSLPAQLEDALVAWNERWSSLVGLDASTDAARDQWDIWHHDGLALLAHLGSALAGLAEVRPEFFVDD